jgi:hypothetical protein
VLRAPLSCTPSPQHTGPGHTSHPMLTGQRFSPMLSSSTSGNAGPPQLRVYLTDLGGS